MLLTVFTPSYNRAYIIGKLYESLCAQTCLDFEWLVVDDGSTDNTRQLIESFIAEGKINIRYIHKGNGGKHTAINLGVREAKGELFFIVDSDDYLTEDAVSNIQNYKKRICSNEFAGIGFMRATPNGIKIGNPFPFVEYIGSAFDLDHNFNVKGDMAEVYKTSVLKLYPFPEICGEKFCPEALVWYRIAEKYKILWVNKCIYICEYHPDGLTKSIVKVRVNSPKTSMLYYSELARRKTSSSKEKLKGAINFWRFSFGANIPFRDKIKQIGALNFLAIIPGYIFSIKDKRSL